VGFLRRHATALVALLALVFAMTGTGIAASRYLITNTSQIKPSVLRQLRTEATAAASKAAKKGAKAVVARVRGKAPEAPPSEYEIPLTDATWTQGAEELDEIPFGLVTGEAGHGCHGEVSVAILLDGEQIGWLTLGGTKIAAHELEWGEPESGRFSYWLPEPGDAVTHTLTAKVVDTCGVVESVSIDVVGLR
jgi:hypothetical protein